MKKTKRILSMALTILLLVTLVVPALSFAAPKDDKKAGPPAFVYDKLKDKFDFIDGKKIKFNNMNVKFVVPPVIKEGRTLIPVRAIEAMGAKVEWDAVNKIVTITKDEIRIFMNLTNGKVYVVNNPTFLFVNITPSHEVTLDVRPGLINNRTFVPLRFIAETFGLKVDYDNGNINVQDQPKLFPKMIVHELKSEIATDAAIKVTLNGYTLDNIKGLTLNNQYTYDVAKTTVYLKEAYLEGLTTETTKLMFVFKKADVTVEKELTIKLAYNAVEKPELSIDEATFKTSTPAAVTVTMDPNGYAFKRIEQNNTTLATSNYELVGNVFTFKLTYLNTLTADTNYYFVFENAGTEMKLKFEIEVE